MAGSRRRRHGGPLRSRGGRRRGPRAAVNAYGGPGSVITGLGALVATLATVAAILLGFLWFPLRRLVETIRVEENRGEGPPAA